MPPDCIGIQRRRPPLSERPASGAIMPPERGPCPVINLSRDDMQAGQDQDVTVAQRTHTACAYFQHLGRERVNGADLVEEKMINQRNSTVGLLLRIKRLGLAVPARREPSEV